MADLSLWPGGGDLRLQVPPGFSPGPLDRALRALLPTLSWTRVRRLIFTGKVEVGGRVVVDPTHPVSPGLVIDLRPRAPRPATRLHLPRSAIVHLDADLVIVHKPAHISTVPFEDGERGSLDQLVRAALNRNARSGRTTGELGVVHRLDRETTGLLVFTRTLAAKRHLQQQFRAHSIERKYLALARGSVRSQTLTSRLVADRGDGRRGSTQHPRLGRIATTHVHALEPLATATLIECQLETGRTHQIRIHLAEAGHPLLGERVYGDPSSTPGAEVARVMLHAASLGFIHPRTGELVRFSCELPEDMAQVLHHLRQPAALRDSSPPAPRPGAPKRPGRSRPRTR